MRSRRDDQEVVRNVDPDVTATDHGALAASVRTSGRASGHQLDVDLPGEVLGRPEPGALRHVVVQAGL